MPTQPAQGAPETRWWDPAYGGSFSSPTSVSQRGSARHFGEPMAGMNWDALRNSQVPRLGEAWLSQIMNDPYNIPEDRLRGSMQESDRAYNVARQRAGSDTLGSGAGQGGVAKGVRAGVESARAGSMSDSMRQWEMYRLSQGDQRLTSMYDPYSYLQAKQLQQNQPGTVPQQKGQSSTEKYLGYAAQIAPLIAMFCWVAREVYGARDPRWLVVRRWLLTKGPRELRELYAAVGPQAARVIHGRPALRRAFRAPLDRIVAAEGF